MAKADEPTNTSDWIWLSEALNLAVAALGSRALAEKRLTQWLAAGDLPWDCIDWQALNDAGIAALHQENRAANFYAATPSVAYRKGDPQFWSAGNLKIDWEDNAAREDVMEGAQALGIKVPRARLLELLPKESRACVEEPLLPIDRAEAVLRDLYSTKAKMPSSLKAAWRDVVARCEKWGWQPMSEETVRRAAEKLGYRPPRKPRRR